MKHNKFIYVILFSIFLGGCKNQKLSVQDAWARPGVEGDNSAVYFVIDNPTPNSDVLSAVESNIAEHVEVHLSKMEDTGMMTMEHQESVQVNPQTRIIFQPGGMHIMLIDLRRDLKLGDKFNLILNFVDAGIIEIEVFIREP